MDEAEKEKIITEKKEDIMEKKAFHSENRIIHLIEAKSVKD